MEEITLGSLFDGIGGFPYAASFYGIRTYPLSQQHRSPLCGLYHAGDMPGAGTQRGTVPARNAGACAGTVRHMKTEYGTD